MNFRNGYILCNDAHVMTCYDYYSIVSSNFAIIGKNGKFGILRLVDDKIIHKCIYDNFHRFKENFILAQKGGKYGIINNEGKTICKCTYNRILHLKDGSVEARKKKKWVSINI